MSWKLRFLTPSPPAPIRLLEAYVLTTVFRNWSICPLGKFQPRGNWQRPVSVPLRKIKLALLFWRTQELGNNRIQDCCAEGKLAHHPVNGLNGKLFKALNSAGTCLFFLLLKQCFFPQPKKPKLANQQLAFETAVRRSCPINGLAFQWPLCVCGCVPQGQSHLRSSHTSWLSLELSPVTPDSTCSLLWNPIFASLLSTNVRVEAGARSKKFRKNFGAFANTCKVRYRGTEKL